MCKIYTSLFGKNQPNETTIKKENGMEMHGPKERKKTAQKQKK